MDRALLTEIVQEQNHTLRSLSPGIRREKLDVVMEALSLPHIIATTGMRRSGKSTLMLQALKAAFA